MLSMARRCPRFVVNAFNTKIAPFSPSLQRTEQTTASSDELAVAFLLKAVVREDNLAKMSDLFHTRFPGLVCTVTAGGAVAERKTTATRIAGTIRLFGMDQVGQLAKISEVLHACGMTILNLYVTTGVCDVETCEFVVREGGPLSENVITVAAMNKETFEEEAFRNEVEDASQEVGYAVTSIILAARFQGTTYANIRCAVCKKACIFTETHVDSSSQYLKIGVFVLILLNLVMLGLEIDQSASLPPGESPPFFAEINLVIVFVFTAEVVLKLAAYGCRGYFMGIEKMWNWFDMIVVALSLFEVVVELLSSILFAQMDANQLRVMRLARLARSLGEQGSLTSKVMRGTLDG
ncbi:scn4aa [Symbiodinium sp. CCMP2456]|nr:scn4aa [Symbiodinium sp. CCMP2456]